MSRIVLWCSIAALIVLPLSSPLPGEARESASPVTKPSTQPTPTTQPADYLDVAEAVFRYQFDHNGSGAQRGATYFSSGSMGAILRWH